jgi:hypothetical protein
MTMTRKRFVLLGTLALLAWPWAGTQAHAHVSFGIRIGVPICFPCCGYYYRPYYPVYVAPAPLYVQPAPVYVQPAPVVAQPTYALPAQPTPVQPAPVQSRYSEGPPAEVNRYLQLLGNADERTRIDAVQQLGRLRAPQAIDPLDATLAGDRSPAVREAAARALGLIGSPQALPALQQAAQADTDHDVRHSAQFAAEVIQSNQGR